MDETKVRSQMQSSLETFVKDIAAIRTGRATVGMVDELVIDAYGGTSKLKVKELATISVNDPQTLVIDPWDKSIIGDIKKGILAANVGLSPIIDGEIIRLSVPPTTGEDRQNHVKSLHTKMENAKIVLRQVRGDLLKDIKKAFEQKEITEDEKFSQEKKLQQFTDEFSAKIEEVGKVKEQEILTL